MGHHHDHNLHAGAAQGAAGGAGAIATTSRIGLIDCTSCEGLIHSILPLGCLGHDSQHHNAHPLPHGYPAPISANSTSSAGHLTHPSQLGVGVVCCEQPACFPPPSLPQQNRRLLGFPLTSSASSSVSAATSSSECDATCLEGPGTPWSSTSASSSSLLFDKCDQCQADPTAASSSANSPLIKSFLSAHHLDCCSSLLAPPPPTPTSNLASYSCCSFDDCFGISTTASITPTSDCPDCFTPLDQQPQNQQHHQLNQDASNSSFLAELMKGLDEQAIQEIVSLLLGPKSLHCCCCAPEIEQNPAAWDVSHHDSHKHANVEPSRALLELSSAANQDHPSHEHNHQQHEHEHPHQPGPATRYDCGWRECKASFDSYALLVVHVNTLHLAPPSIATLSAPTAPPSSVLRPKVRAHRHATHSSHPYNHFASNLTLAHESAVKEESVSAPGPHACRWKGCSATFPSSAELMSHLSLGHVGSGKSSYSCEWEGCSRSNQEGGRQFSQRQKVIRHLQTHAQDKPFACDLCDRKFSEALSLAQHKRTHTGERPYECTWERCDKAFASASALTIHMRTHTGDRPFVCDFPGCKAAFAESSNLAKHARTHRGERSHQCPECDKTFLRSDQLARHMKIHEREAAGQISAGSGSGETSAQGSDVEISFV
ncbi:BQ5605_C008g05215 [Microbotryum silenes-dioicae]|uniref:BQ5605_C008g05215 protein n=1 Tax=Microbotryum silenes-dioicae TaxID=796604 RepID=A0A2X0MZG6_9BASI|nr:BQ5605_C008g05215 [Microbotryum silenes-dioicae]